MTISKLPVTICFAISALAGLTQAQEEAPATWFEEFAYGDGSKTKAMGFETVPGVAYSVESSDSLVTWTEEFAVYGLGQTHHVPMIWFEPPGQTPPPDPPTGGEEPGEFVSLIMKSSSAPEGGVIVSWRSLEDGAPLTTVVAGTPDPGWEACPISIHEYGEYRFFIMVLSEKSPPSGEPPSFGSLDQDMIDAFAANFAAMDLDMANGHGSASTTPGDGKHAGGVVGRG